MQQIYGRSPMPKCVFSKVPLQVYWNHAWHGFSSVHLLLIFRTPFLKNTSGWLLLYFPKNLRQSYMLLVWQVPKYASDILRSLTKLFQVDVARLLDIHHLTIWKPPYEKCVRIRSYSGPHFPAFGLNNSEYGHFLCSATDQN